MTSSNQVATTIQTQEPENAFSMTSLMLNPAIMDRLEKLAAMMAKGSATIPKHLQGNAADCMAVAMQSAQWGLNPFAVAQKTHLSQSGQLGYEAQLISAVVTGSGAVDGDPEYEYIGDWDKILGKVEERKSEKSGGKYYVATYTRADEAGLGIICKLRLKGEANPRELKLMMSQCWPRFSTQWATNPKMQISYAAIRQWARLHKPGVILGIYTPDELIEQPEKFMGAAEVVTETKVDGIPKELRDAALNASGQGLKSFQSWFKTLTPDQRVAIGPLRPECEAIWQKADANRTVDNPTATPAASPAPAPATQGDAPVVTLKSVLDRMNSAKNMDGLDVAYDWANELTDPKEIEQTETLYATLKAKFGA